VRVQHVLVTQSRRAGILERDAQAVQVERERLLGRRVGLVVLAADRAVLVEAQVVLPSPPAPLPRGGGEGLGVRGRQPVLDAEPRGGECVAQVFEPVRLAFDGPPQFVDPGPVLAVGAEKAADERVLLLEAAAGCSLSVMINEWQSVSARAVVHRASMDRVRLDILSCGRAAYSISRFLRSSLLARFRLSHSFSSSI